MVKNLNKVDPTLDINNWEKFKPGKTEFSRPYGLDKPGVRVIRTTRNNYVSTWTTD